MQCQAYKFPLERSLIGLQKLSATVRELHPSINQVIKDNYVLEFLGLPERHSENDLQKALRNSKR
ncbi:MAG: hypothetical protein ABSB19_05535 [Methylomonas sp.]|jgi:predicted nuclease of restriction endonuclease-like (RecB) superfamily